MPSVIPKGAVPPESIAARIRPVPVLLEVQPQNVERQRAVVGVADLDRAGDDMARRVERAPDRVIGPVLPILRSGPAVGRAIDARRLAGSNGAKVSSGL